MIIKNSIENIPSTTGIYFFYADDVPIYIGKAINLHARLTSHIRNAELDHKESAIITQSTHITYKTTLSEFDALLLEARYIKEFRPKYNVSWKDDKSYLYIKITIKERYPKVFLVRAENDRKSIYFGPFKSSRIASILMREIRRVVPFCTQKKISKSPCFYSKINLCNPCPNVIEKYRQKEETVISNELYKIYKRNIRYLCAIFNGKSNIVIKYLEDELKRKSTTAEYESAIVLRNKLHFLTELVTNRSFESRDLETNHESDRIVHFELQNLLLTKFDKKKKKAEYRIECFDVSNLSGKNATASMVVFINSRSDKKHYRKFKIKTVHKISDIEMLTEALQRRLNRKEWPLPDLLIIDGGKPQLRAIDKVLKGYQIESKIPLLGLAKNPDRIYLGVAPFKPLFFEENSPLFTVLQAIRDESHRFAKKYHVLLRKRNLLL